MLVVSGTMIFRPDRVEDAHRVAIAMMAQSSAEAGCRVYEFSARLDDPSTFRLFEAWDSAEALAAHFQTPHFQAFSADLPGFLAAAPTVLRYEIAEVAPLM